MNTTTTKRITKAMYYADIRAILNGEAAPNKIAVPDIINFIDREVELVSKKNSSGTRKPTATQQENEGYKALILDFLALQPEGATCAQVQKGVPELSEYNNQKVGGLLGRLYTEGKVSRIKGKKGLFVYSLA